MSNEDSDVAQGIAIRGAQRVLATRGAPAHERQQARRVLSKAGIDPDTGLRGPHWDPDRPNQKVYPQLTKAEARAVLAQRDTQTVRGTPRGFR